jgi:hypothetical protein
VICSRERVWGQANGLHHLARALIPAASDTAARPRHHSGHRSADVFKTINIQKCCNTVYRTCRPALCVCRAVHVPRHGGPAAPDWYTERPRAPWHRTNASHARIPVISFEHLHTGTRPYVYCKIVMTTLNTPCWQACCTPTMRIDSSIDRCYWPELLCSNSYSSESGIQACPAFGRADRTVHSCVTSHKHVLVNRL